MKLLITGGLGFIGSHTAYMAIESGYEVVILDNLSRGNREALPPGAQWISGDLRDPKGIEEVFQNHLFDGVLHFAAFCYVGESVQKPDLYYQNNLMGSLNLLQNMVRFGVKKLIFSSTAAVYGNPFRKEKNFLKIREDFPRKPIHPYGRSKAFFEEILEDYFQKDFIEFVSLRYFNAAGAHPDGILGEKHIPETHLIPILIEAALGRREKAVIYGTDYPTPDGTCIRDFIHVWDLARAHLLALDQIDHLKGGFYNLGTERGYSIREVMDRVKKVTNRDFCVEEGPPRPGDPPALVASAEKAKKDLGWEPQFSDLDTIIQHSFQWFQNPYWKFTSPKKIR